MSNHHSTELFFIQILDKWDSIWIYIVYVWMSYCLCAFWAIYFVAVLLALLTVYVLTFFSICNRQNLESEANSEKNLRDSGVWIIRQSTSLFKGFIYSKIYFSCCFPESISLCFQWTFKYKSMNNLLKQLILFSTWRLFLCTVWLS